LRGVGAGCGPQHFEDSGMACWTESAANNTEWQSMKMEIYVAGVSHDVWFRGSRDKRQVTMLNCLDRTAHEGLKLKQTFDYVPTKDEEDALELEKLDGSCLVLAVDEIKAANGGRLKFKEKLTGRAFPNRRCETTERRAHRSRHKRRRTEGAASGRPVGVNPEGRTDGVT
jgi:hypothetical protein